MVGTRNQLQKKNDKNEETVEDMNIDNLEVLGEKKI